MTAVAVALVVMVVMGETVRLVASAVSPDGEAASLRTVIGPLAWTKAARCAWAIWEAPRPRSVTGWIVVHTCADVLFYLSYSALLLRAFGDHMVARRLTWALLLAEAIETALLLGAAYALWHGSVPVWLRSGESVVGTVKWVTAAVLALTVVRVSGLRTRLGQWAWLAFGGLKYQRWSAVPVALLGGLAFVSGPDIWDQLPDVVRGWVGGPAGVWHGIVAFLTSVALVVPLFVLGRHRARRARLTRGEGTPPIDPVPPRVWLIGPAIVLATAGLLDLFGPNGTVPWWHVLLFAAVPTVGVLTFSALVAACKPDLWTEPKDLCTALVPVVRRMGDGLALAAVAVFGLGLVRAFTAPALLAGTRRDNAVLLLVAGATLAILAWPIGAALVRALDKARWFDTLLARNNTKRWVGWAGPVSSVLAAGVLALLLLKPATTSGALGPYATVTAAFGAWVILLGFLVVYLQDRQAPEIFRLFHLRAVPVFTLLILVSLVASFLPSTAGLHRIRTLERGSAAQRPSLDTAFAAWVERAKGCRRVVGGVEVQPMLVIAASGGGIRAAYWTTKVLTTLARDACGLQVTLLSSGVSGGSVGLAMARHAIDPDTATTVDDAIEAMADPATLGVGLTGTAVGDLVAGIAGIRVPALGEDRDKPTAWVDRAGLMERSWEDAAPWLSAPWDATPSGPGGILVLNSTASGHGCRVVVSQVDLSSTDNHDRANCHTRSGLPAASLDLVETYHDCLPPIRWTTAAMLSARFPFVTPAGRLPRNGCPESPDLQLIDGGYAEGSGVGTLAEIAPDLVRLIREHNRNPENPVVVPFVAYLEDEVRSDVTAQQPRTTPEALVPIVGFGAKQTLTTSAAHLQRVARAFADPCPAGANKCSSVVQALHARIPDGVVLVAPSTRPSVVAPLGWTLSPDSRDRLDKALSEQRQRCTPTDHRYAGLGALLSLLRADAKCSPFG